ncbi:hypothetical protein RJ640_028573 [Escallonia rubra]|uniref:Pentatricopeptide repeat-containing protein n=1 Tax=Escallonia rubra TaxID=112253 RepID=A0AA88UHN1_9ASTE|nr:hypothetical protein RJ640_028573 [Escallonia rubra]
MNSLQIQIRLQRSKTTSHLLQLQALIIKTALDHDEYCTSNFILSACPISVDLARLIFDTSPIKPPLFAWNTIIKHYSKSSTPVESINLFSQLQRFGLKPDKFTFPFVLKACGHCSFLGLGGTVHSLVLKVGFDSDKYVNNNLLRMYGGCGVIGLARQVFDEMPERDVVSWSSMIARYVDCNSPVAALMAFLDMKLVNEKPNSVTLVSLLSACTHLLDIRLGESIHSFIVVNDIGLDVILGTALLDMYAKCGHVQKALHIFNSMREKNLQSWTVMISGLADNGNGEAAISLFTKMEEGDLKPDGMSFSGILSACSHLGLVVEGQKYFERMLKVYNIRPTMEHYGCMVDMFGRAGMIEEAYQLIRSMPMEPNSVVLRSFISSCKQHGSVVRIDEYFRQLLLDIEPDHGANYVLAAAVSSLSGYWSEVDDLRISMKGKGLRKVPGCSWVEVSGASTGINC